MEYSVLTSKGQIEIPKTLRKKYRIKPGTRIAFVEKEGEITIRAFTKEYFESLAGWLTDDGDILADLIKEKEVEKKHDEKHSLR